MPISLIFFSRAGCILGRVFNLSAVEKVMCGSAVSVTMLCSFRAIIWTGRQAAHLGMLCTRSILEHTSRQGCVAISAVLVIVT